MQAFFACQSHHDRGEVAKQMSLQGVFRGAKPAGAPKLNWPVPRPSISSSGICEASPEEKSSEVPTKHLPTRSSGAPEQSLMFWGVGLWQGVWGCLGFEVEG